MDWQMDWKDWRIDGWIELVALIEPSESEFGRLLSCPVSCVLSCPPSQSFLVLSGPVLSCSVPFYPMIPMTPMIPILFCPFMPTGTAWDCIFDIHLVSDLNPKPPTLTATEENRCPSRSETILTSWTSWTLTLTPHTDRPLDYLTSRLQASPMIHLPNDTMENHGHVPGHGHGNRKSTYITPNTSSPSPPRASLYQPSLSPSLSLHHHRIASHWFFSFLAIPRIWAAAKSMLGRWYSIPLHKPPDLFATFTHLWPATKNFKKGRQTLRHQDTNVSSPPYIP